MSKLTACIIGLSPCIGTQVSAIWIPSAGQNIDIENCSKDQLLEVVPDLWESFWDVYYAAGRVAKVAADTAGNAGGIAYYNASNVVNPSRVVSDATGDIYDSTNAAARVGALDFYILLKYALRQKRQQKSKVDKKGQKQVSTKRD